tara:strand:+ start:151 stop:606 length:456 start_codon:yes stop_codon:yes gene_type:complete
MEDNSLKILIEEAIKVSMKSGEKEKTTTLRMAMSEIKKQEIDKKSDLDNQEITFLIQRMIKQRKDSSSHFQSAGREELALKEEREIETLSEFLPAQLSEEEISAFVKEAVEALNAETNQDIGRVMGTLKTNLQGKADMSLVSKIVKERLTK